MSDGTILAGTLAFLAAGLLAAALVGLFNRLVRVRNNVRKAWSNIDVLLRQRHDEIPNLAETVRGAAAHERAALEEVAGLRASFDAAVGTDTLTLAENAVQLVLLGLMGRAEAYPDLKANASFLALQRRLSELETRIAERRAFFNDCVAVYNSRIESFPERAFARLLGYTAHPFLEAGDAARRSVPLDFRP